MLRHVVMFKWNDEVPDEALDALERDLLALSKLIPEIENYRFGPDLALREGNFDYCLVAEFEDAGAFERYVVHPKHQALIQQRLTPILSQRIAVQYEI